MELRVGPNPAERAADWIAGRLRRAVHRRGLATVALSGGGTAPRMLAALMEHDLPWERVWVWQVDERIAPDGHAARNANQLRALAELPCRVRLMPVEAPDRRLAADRYARSLPDRFDVVHLGLGEDGHTASWPPGDDVVRNSRAAVELVAAFNGWDRMTLTRRVVNRARRRVVLASGAAKRPVVERWLGRDTSLPITAIRRSDTWAFLDEAAAPSRPFTATH